MKIILIILLSISISYGKTNVSLSKILMAFQGHSYNMLIAPKQIVLSGKMKKTRKAIHKGYKRAISELERQVILRDIDFNLKFFTAKGSRIPSYEEQDIESYELLNEMLKQQVSLREQLLEEVNIKSTSKVALNVKKSIDDIDVDIGDDAFDITNDVAEVENEGGELMNISPSEAFTSSYIELAELYNQQVLELSKTTHPFLLNSKPVMKKVHSVFGMAFSLQNMEV